MDFAIGWGQAVVVAVDTSASLVFVGNHKPADPGRRVSNGPFSAFARHRRFATHGLQKFS